MIHRKEWDMNAMGWYGGQRPPEIFTADNFREQYARRLERIDGGEAYRTVALSETLNELFHRDTLVLAPGKSESDAAPSGLTHEERAILYESWLNVIRDNCFSYFTLELLQRDIEVEKLKSTLTEYRDIIARLCIRKTESEESPVTDIEDAGIVSRLAYYDEPIKDKVAIEIATRLLLEAV